jgi:UDP-N-acetylmuramate--alanine ligase
MSAVAQALLDSGAAVSGSDRLRESGGGTPTLACLARQGAKLFDQDGSGVDAGVGRVVVSTAIEEDNPDVARSRELGLSVEHRAAALNRLVSGRELVAVTGTCGKSSVTAMLGVILAGCGFDPLVINGAAVCGWSDSGGRIGSVRPGAGIVVIEADESDRSLMVFRPHHAVITNASADHFALDETGALFDAFRAVVAGHVVDGRMDAPECESFRTAGLTGSFTLEGIEYAVPVPGAHNLRNARQAVRMALALGADPRQAAAALAAFGGVERRLQIMGKCGAATVIDDYAHNPEKLAAAWTTLARAFPGGICGLWRPHGYAPLRKMCDDLAEMFGRVCRGGDRLLLLPVYDAGGTADRSVGSEDLALKLKAKGVKVELVWELEAAESRMRELAAECAVLACFGARDPGLPQLAARLAD